MASSIIDSIYYIPNVHIQTLHTRQTFIATLLYTVLLLCEAIYQEENMDICLFCWQYSVAKIMLYYVQSTFRFILQRLTN